MGEAKRVLQMGPQARVPHPNQQQQQQQQQQIQVDLSKATIRTCECGSDLFDQAIRCYTISALVSPTGQELRADVPVLVCRKCGKVVEK